MSARCLNDVKKRSQTFSLCVTVSVFNVCSDPLGCVLTNSDAPFEIC